MPDDAHPFDAPLRAFAAEVTKSFTSGGGGEPEAQLTVPFAALVAAVASATGRPLVANRETLIDRIGMPDFALTDGGEGVPQAEVHRLARPARCGVA